LDKDKQGDLIDKKRTLTKKMEDKSTSKPEDKLETTMQETFKHVLADHGKGMKQQMAEHSIKHAAQLKALKKHKWQPLPPMQD
jgi:hypothetical protein